MDFTEYVAARGRSLWRAAWLFTGDAQLAEDLVQTALTKAWPHFDRVSSSGSFEAYVRRALVTTYISWRGRRWRAEIPAATVPERPGRRPRGRRAPGPSLAHVRGSAPAAAGGVVLRYFEDLTESQAAEPGLLGRHREVPDSRALAPLRTSGLLAPDDLEEAR